MHKLVQCCLAGFTLLLCGSFQFLHKPVQLSPDKLEEQQALFRKLFGESVVSLDPAAVTKVKATKAGERLKLDTNGDGKIDTVYFIDDDPKHEAAFRPLLVKVIDRDGDMDRNGAGDIDSDIWIADWNADSSVDSVIAYVDTDRDNDLDEMAIYTYSLNDRFMKRDVMRVWWSRDVGDDNQLWDSINYRYQQRENQFRTHFAGDEMLSSLAYDDALGQWIPSFENPFVFYDTDRDDLSEITIRFSGMGGKMESLRYSVDVDNDTAGENSHDYDFSFSCVVSNPGVVVPEPLMERISLEGGLSAPILSWKNARQFAETARWGKVLLTWDENDNNVDATPGADPHERWEGILNSPTDKFPQVGGPACGPYNKRYETDLDNSGEMRLYYLPADQRIHLLGADEAWTKVDYNYDGKVDMEFRYVDSTRDGIIDIIEIDLDGDQKIDRSFHLDQPNAATLSLDYRRLSDLFRLKLDRALTENQTLIDAIKRVLQTRAETFREDEIERYFREELPRYRSEAKIGEKITASREGMRYYQDLIRERYYVRLIELLANDPSFVRQLDKFYNAGDYSETSRLLKKKFPAAFGSGSNDWSERLSKRIVFTVSNPDSQHRLTEPVVLLVADIRKVAPDFNARNMAVLEAEKRIISRELPSQADDLNSDGRPDELVFEVNLHPLETQQLFIYYSPDGQTSHSYEAKTAASPDWLGNGSNVAWESDKIAYRIYYGQMDFFGKKQDQLILKTLGKAESYHKELDWGMDVLLVGKTAGIGGISVWEGDRSYPAFHPGGPGDLRIQQKVVAEGPVRSTVAVNTQGVRSETQGYEIDQLFSAYAGNRYSENRIRVHSAGKSTDVIFSAGFIGIPNDTHFFNNKRGYFGAWGKQDLTIQEIGVAGIFPPSAIVGMTETSLQRDVRMRLGNGRELKYYVVGDWRRGRTFPVAPTAQNWEKEIKLLAERVLRPVVTRLVRVESKTAISR